VLCIIDLCDNAGVVDKSLYRSAGAKVRRPERVAPRPFRAVLVMWVQFIRYSQARFKFDAIPRSPMSSYSNRIFQEQFSISTTVLTKPFPSCKMHEGESLFFFCSTTSRRNGGIAGRNLEARELRGRQRRGKCEASSCRSFREYVRDARILS